LRSEGVGDGFDDTQFHHRGGDVRTAHLTDPARGIQLRFGHDNRWYPYESDPGAEDWWPTGRADPDPVGALTALLGQ
ncbi:hypothetical protein ADK76_12510, partial [Streptomyces griseoflavus]